MELKASEYGGMGNIEAQEGRVVIGPGAPRYALFHPDKGVFIDDNIWSYMPESEEHDRIRTFLKFQVDDLKALFAKQGLNDLVVVDIVPDKKFALASIKACVAVGLPGWEYNADKYGRDPEDEDEPVEDSDSQSPEAGEPDSGAG